MVQYKSKIMRAIAEMNNLVTSPPRSASGECEEQWIKDNIDQMNCVEITVTFKPKLQNTTDLTLKEITKGILEQCMEGRGKVILLHEYSSGGLFHYHGIISGVSRKILSVIRKNFTLHIGRIEIKTITYFESYVNYMLKDTIHDDYDNNLNIHINNF